MVLLVGVNIAVGVGVDIRVDAGAGDGTVAQDGSPRCLYKLAHCKLDKLHRGVEAYVDVIHLPSRGFLALT